MRALRPMAQDERVFAEHYHDLVIDFIHCKHLPMDEYYDVVVFGYLSAVQQYFRNPPTDVGFKVMAFRAMKDSILREGEYHSRAKRYGTTMSLDALDGQIPDSRQNPEQQVVDKTILKQVMNLATSNEFKIINLLMDGFVLQEAARLLKISRATATTSMEKFYFRAKAVI